MDKNGRLVTRHVKAIAAQPPSPGTFIPPVGSITLHSNVDGLPSIWNSHRISRSGIKLEDLDQDAVAEIERLMETYKGAGSAPKMGLQISVTSALSLIESEGIHNELHNLAVFGKHIFPYCNVESEQYVRALHEMTAPEEIDYLNGATDEQRASAEALISFTVRAEAALGEKVIRYSTEDPEEDFEYTELRDPELTRFIMDNPDKAEDVLDILTQEKDSIPVDVIKMRLLHDEKALNGGVL